MLRYETLILAVPEITADEASTIQSQLEKTVEEAKATVISYERWGKYALAYPVRHNDYGVYYLMRFETDEEHKSQALEALKSTFSVKYTEIIMRHITVRLEPQASLDYVRPDSLEEAPTRDVDTFLKENKMSGLLHKTTLPSALVTDEVDIDEEDEQAMDIQ